VEIAVASERPQRGGLRRLDRQDGRQLIGWWRDAHADADDCLLRRSGLASVNPRDHESVQPHSDYRWLLINSLYLAPDEQTDLMNGLRC
jgi:hypothetical protein